MLKFGSNNPKNAEIWFKTPKIAKTRKLPYFGNNRYKSVPFIGNIYTLDSNKLDRTFIHNSNFRKKVKNQIVTD